MIKFCIGCQHFNPVSRGCRRKIVATGLDLVFGVAEYATTKELVAYQERYSWLSRFFGCGRRGKFWLRSK